MTTRTAVVTGANRGIGEEIARELAKNGLAVIAGDRSARAPSGGAPIGGRGRGAPDTIERFPLDVTSDASLGALAAHLEQKGGVDVLVNNAGISMSGFDENVVKRTLEVNFFGAMRTTDRLLPLVREGGRIVMMSSGMGELSAVSPALRARFLDPKLDRAGLRALVDGFVRGVAAGTHEREGWPSSAYRVSKIALNALTRVLARELAGDRRRILVNAVDPGWVRTRMGGAGAPRSIETGARTPVWLALLPEGGPTGGFFRDERPIGW